MALPGTVEEKDAHDERHARAGGEGVVREIADGAEKTSEDHKRGAGENKRVARHESTFAVADAVVAQCERGDGGQVADAGARQGRGRCVLW